MGACGCSETDLLLQFQGPAGTAYGLEVYASCDYCHTPAGIVLHWFLDPGEEIAAAFLSTAKEAEFLEGQCAVPVLDPDVLAEELGLEFGDRHELRRLLPEAVSGTQQAWGRSAL